MLHKLQAKLALTDSEAERVYRTGFLFLLLTTGFEIGKIARDSYFLSNVGAQQIPYLYLFIALFVFVISAIYGRYLSHMQRDGLMKGIQWGGIVFVTGFWYLIWFQPFVWGRLPHVLYCTVEAYALFTTMHFWTLANDIFDADEGKRFFPLLGCAGIMGTIVGGIVTNLIAHYLSSSFLLLAWTVLLILSLFVTPRARAMPTPMLQQSRKDANSVESHAESALLQIWREPLIRTLTFMAFPMWIIIYIVDFSFFNALNRTFIDQDLLARFLGAFVSFCSVIGLLLQVFVTPRLIKYFGVSATSLVYPITLTIGTTALLLFTLMPPSEAGALELGGLVMLVLFARFCDIGIYFSVYDSSSQLLYYAVPEYLRAQGRAFVSGLIFPLGITLAGVLILAFRAVGEPLYNVAFVGVAMAFLLVVLGLNVTPDYLKALLASASKGDNDERLEVLKEIAKVGSSDTYYVLLQSIASKDQAEAAFAVAQIQELEVRDMYVDLEEILGDIAPSTLDKLVSQLSSREDPEAIKFVEKARQQMAIATAEL